MWLLDPWKQKLQDASKEMDRKDFVRDISSWQAMTFYKTSQGISRYPKSERVIDMVDAEMFVVNGHGDNFREYEYDMSRSFFENIQALRRTIPFPQLRQWRWSENVQYADVAFAAKNAYLSSIVCFGAENTFYSFSVGQSTNDVWNSVHVVNNSAHVYQSMNVVNGYNIFYSSFIANCSDVWFSSDLIGCTECLFCSGLENQSYCIENVVYSKDEYTKKKQELLSQKEKFEERWKHLISVGLNRWSVDSSWRGVVLSENVKGSLMTVNVRNGRNNILVWAKDTSIENSYGNILSGSNASDVYSCHGVSPGDNIYFTMNSAWSHLFYSYFLIECSYCLWCFWLVNKSYCIFNKQYDKDERYTEVERIFSQMEKEGTFGTFFPWRLNPFYFNDTAAFLIEDFNKQEILDAWYLWRDDEVKVDIPEWVNVVSVDELSNYQGWMIDGEFVSVKEYCHSVWAIATEESRKVEYQGDSSTSSEWRIVYEGSSNVTRTIHPDILQKVVEDKQWNYYRIIPQEYKFLKKYWLPLPSLHWLERLKWHFRIEKLEWVESQQFLKNY